MTAVEAFAIELFRLLCIVAAYCGVMGLCVVLASMWDARKERKRIERIRPQRRNDPQTGQ